MLLSRQTHTRSICRINWRVAVRLNLLLTLLLWVATLLPFCYWTLFRQTGPRRASLLWVFGFLFKHEWRGLLKIAVAEWAWSLTVSLIAATLWNKWVRYRKRKVASNVSAPDLKPGVWPPPPNVPEQ